MRGSTHLFIPDSHSQPGVDNDRFEWLGNLALDLRPDAIIDSGDWADMESLSSYDKGLRSFEGRRYNKDIASAVDARKRFNAPIERFNSGRRRNGKRMYRPRKVALTGNHEERILRATNLHPELEGTISLDDLQRERFGWETYDFLVPVEIDGVNYVHYTTSGAGRNAISGQYPAANLLRQEFKSTSVGHSHGFDYAIRTAGTGERKLHGLVGGCFFRQYMDYASPKQNASWWRGVCIKTDVRNGEYDLHQMSMDEVERHYG